MKRYTFVTTYIVEAPNEMKAAEVKAKIGSQLMVDNSVAEYWTNLTDIEDAPSQESAEESN